MYLTANSAISSEKARKSLAGWFGFMLFQCSADPPLHPRWTLGRCLLPGGEVFRYRSKIKNRYVLNIANQSFGAMAVNWHKHPFSQENVPYRQLCHQFRKGAEESCRLVWFHVIPMFR